MGNANEEQAPNTDERNDAEQQNSVTNNLEFAANEVSPVEVPKPKSNAYINFMQAFQRRYKKSNLKSKDLVRQGAAVWRSMTNEQKKPYIDMAQKVKTVGGRRPQYKQKHQRRQKTQRRITKTVVRHRRRRVNPYSTINTCSRVTGSRVYPSDLVTSSDSTSASSFYTRWQ